MPDVDWVAVWRQGRTVFTAWFTVASLVGNFLFVSSSTRLSLGKSIAADFAMTGAFWLAMPISLAASVLVQEILFGGRGNLVGWIIAALISALICALSGLVVLVAFKQKLAVSAFRLLIAVNLVCFELAVYRMVAEVSAHQPFA